MAEGLRVEAKVAEMGGVEQYLHLLVGQVRGRVGYECFSDNRLRDAIDEFIGSLPRPLGYIG